MCLHRYCLQHSPVPVIVVHPFQRRQHRKQKREKDPDRQSYINLLKLAQEFNSSNDSLETDSFLHDIPAINLDLHHEDKEKGKPTVLVHAVTAPGRIESINKEDSGGEG